MPEITPVFESNLCSTFHLKPIQSGGLTVEVKDDDNRVTLTELESDARLVDW